MPALKDKIGVLIADEIEKTHLKILNPLKFKIDIRSGIKNSDILKLPGNYKVLIIRSTRNIDKFFLKSCKFEVIASCSRGIDNIDVDFASGRGIKIINSEFGNYISTAEHTFALILSIYKGILYSDKLVRSGNFLNTDFKRLDLKGKKIGIIGIGKVGSYVAKLASALGMIIYANDIDIEVKKKNSNLNFKSLNYILANSDIITVHIPLNKFNEKFFSKGKLELLRENSVFINTSRGRVIDEKYLIKMLYSKKIFFAGLDVFENEPHINKRLFALDNVILTNHIAGKSQESMRYIIKEILLQVINYYTN